MLKRINGSNNPIAFPAHCAVPQQNTAFIIGTMWIQVPFLQVADSLLRICQTPCGCLPLSGTTNSSSCATILDSLPSLFSVSTTFTESGPFLDYTVLRQRTGACYVVYSTVNADGSAGFVVLDRLFGSWLYV